MVPILERTVESLYGDEDIETVEKGIPANLLLLRGLCASDPGNRDLWALTAQLYFYYGFGFVEDRDLGQAALVYRQGVTLGRQALARKSWFRPEEDFNSFQRGLLDARVEDVPLLFWTGASWAAWVGRNVDDPAAIAELPLAEAILERVLALDPDYMMGLPHAMAGTLKGMKPVMMGGKPEEARMHFEEAFRLSGRRMLIFQTLYARYYCRAVLDEECFTEVVREVLDAPADIEPGYRLLNEVARRKARILMEMKDDWF